MSNRPPENQHCNPEEVWTQLDPETRAQIVKQLSRLAYRFVVDQFKKSIEEKQDERSTSKDKGTSDSP